jgi:hypothetical protein
MIGGPGFAAAVFARPVGIALAIVAALIVAAGIIGLVIGALL